MYIEEKLLQEYNEKDISSGKMVRLSNKVINAENKLKKELNEKQCEMFSEFIEAQDKQAMAQIDEALIYGFRFAVSLINDLKKINF